MIAFIVHALVYSWAAALLYFALVAACARPVKQDVVEQANTIVRAYASRDLVA